MGMQTGHRGAYNQSLIRNENSTHRTTAEQSKKH